MRIIKDILAAFAMYSRIPVPGNILKEDDGKGAIAFLPFIGMVIGAVICLISYLTADADIPVAVLTFILILVPVLITGGFHIDGYMDVTDALSSYHDKEKSLEIMKDPHIGAFAVIGIIKTGLIWIAALYMTVYRCRQEGDMSGLCEYALLFVIVRACCGIICIMGKKAKENGMLYEETKSTGRAGVILLGIQFGAASLAAVCVNMIPAVVSIAALLLYTPFFLDMCKKRFGGINGDCAGYYIVQGETIALAVLAICSMLISYIAA